MAQKTRSQLTTQSNGTFQDAPPANITPTNHRQYNDDLVDSAAMVADGNTFSAGNTFEQTVISTVSANTDALFAADGDIYLQGGGIDCGGSSSLNTTFIRTLQNAFDPTVYYASNPTLDLSNAEGNIIYIEGDGEINSWIGVQGRFYHAIFTGNVYWNVQGGDVMPNNNFQMFPNDTLIFVFVTNSNIRIVGRYRATDSVNNQNNGQNYYQINLPQDALDLMGSGRLDVGATYRVMGAIELPKLSGYFWDVYLKATNPDLFAETCYIKCADFNGTEQKAWFTGSFDGGAILITDKLDTTVDLTWGLANSNAGGGSTVYAKGGAKTFINDNDLWFNGYVFHNLDGKTQVKNILDCRESNNAFGAIWNCLDALNNQVPYFIPNHGNTANGVYGANFTLRPVPTVSQVQGYNRNNVNINITINDYNCSYQVVNDTCVVYFYADVITRFTGGNSTREAVIRLPIPFSGQGANRNPYGYGTLRNITGTNHSDMGLLVTRHSSEYMEITAKWSSAINSDQTCIISGCFIYPELTHP